LCDAGLVKGKRIGIDATTLEANAALRSIVRRDTGEIDHAYELAKAEVERRVELWDWDEDVDLIGVARVVAQRAYRKILKQLA
jgi:hypothetical protein